MNRNKILILILLLTGFTFGQKRISELPAATSLKATDYFPIVVEGGSVDTTKRITWTNLWNIQADSTQNLVDQATTLAKAFNNQTIYSSSAPTMRSDSSALVTGDQWINPDSSNLSHVYVSPSWVISRNLTSDWTYLGNIPSYIGTPSAGYTGLAIDASHIAYYSSGTPTTYIDNAGHFYFAGDATKYISWNGTSFDIRGNLNADDINTGKIRTIVLEVDSISGLNDRLVLKANKSLVDSVNGRLGTAESSIDMINDTLTYRGGQVQQLMANMNLKANVTKVDSLGVRTDSAEAGISLHAWMLSLQGGQISTLSSNLNLYARKDSIISFINLSPELIQINGENISLDGNVEVNGSFKVNGVNIQSVYPDSLVSGSILNNLAIKSTLTMGSAATTGTIQSYGWNGTANGFQIVGGASPTVSLIGGTFTGGTFQTAASGARAEMSAANGFRIYNSGGSYASLSLNVGNTLNINTVVGLQVGGNAILLNPDPSIGIQTPTLSATGSISAGSLSSFIVNSSGNITKINNVATSFPSSQGGANTYLKNDGSGNLSWAAGTMVYPGAGIAVSTGSGWGTSLANNTAAWDDAVDWIAAFSESDPNIYAWAKAATKPSYNFTEIGNRPTTLSGYGITDACSSGDPRLSDARPASDVYAWAKAATKPSYTYSEVGAQAALSGTGFVKISGTTISYDNSTYLTSASSLDPSKVSQTSSYRFVSDTEKSTWDGKVSLNSIEVSSPLAYDSDTHELGIYAASTSTSGFLSSTDWNTFNNKVTFPGFGTSHSTAAYGDHNHSGVYAPVFSGLTQTIVLSSGESLEFINGILTAFEY
jgi:hypothetical protein